MLLKRKSTTGSRSSDYEIDRIYESLSRLQLSGRSSSGVTNNNYVITDLGAIAYKFDNKSGVQLVNGANVQYWDGGVSLAPADSRANFGIVYGDWLPYGPCYVVVNGMCLVYFNSNGATAGEWARMSRSGDTAYPDAGMAQSLPFNYVDPLQYFAIVLESRTGEGVTKCIKVR